jgi:hypothetical protein
MLLAIGGFLALCVISALATTTREQRAEAQARFDRRWNPILIPLNIILWAFLIWGFFYPKR